METDNLKKSCFLFEESVKGIHVSLAKTHKTFVGTGALVDLLIFITSTAWWVSKGEHGGN